MASLVDSSISWLEKIVIQAEKDNEKIEQRQAARKADMLNPNQSLGTIADKIRSDGMMRAHEGLEMKKRIDGVNTLKDIVRYNMEQRNKTIDKIFQNG